MSGFSDKYISLKTCEYFKEKILFLCIGTLWCFPPFLIMSSSKIPPLDMTIDSWPFAINALEKSFVPLSTPPIFNSGNN